VNYEQFATLVKSYVLGAPLTVGDCADLFAEIKPKLPAGYQLDVILRGGTSRDPGPQRIEVAAHTQFGTWRVYLEANA
jgi:hypothetical protein